MRAEARLGTLVVTGGGRGIGAQIAMQAARAGRPKRDLGTDTAATAGHDQGPCARLMPGCRGHDAS